jgi:hypothetical protein
MEEVGQQLRPSIKRRWHPLDWVALACAALAMVNALTIPLIWLDSRGY